jgi:hypothetical protein
MMRFAGQAVVVFYRIQKRSCRGNRQRCETLRIRTWRITHPVENAHTLRLMHRVVCNWAEQKTTHADCKNILRAIEIH